MILINYSDVYNSIDNSLSERFGDEVSVLGYDEQIIVAVKPEAKNETLIKFNQTMNYLSNKPTWYSKKNHAVEDVFEKALAGWGIPLKARENQRVEFIYKPHECANALCKFLQDRNYSRDAEERNKRLCQCYEAVDKALNTRKKYSYKKKENGKNGQRKLFHFYKGQLEIDDIDTNNSNGKGERNNGWRKIRFDIIYEMPEPKSLIFSEIKAFPTLGNRLIEERAQQLMAYDAWLKAVAEDCCTPFLYVLPTALSYKEVFMASDVGKRTKRKIIPLVVSSLDYLKYNLKGREKTAKRVVNNTKFDISPEVVEVYKNEMKHISEWSSDMGNLLIGCAD